MCLCILFFFLRLIVCLFLQQCRKTLCCGFWTRQSEFCLSVCCCCCCYFCFLIIVGVLILQCFLSKPLFPLWFYFCVLLTDPLVTGSFLKAAEFFFLLVCFFQRGGGLLSCWGKTLKSWCCWCVDTFCGLYAVEGERTAGLACLAQALPPPSPRPPLCKGLVCL